MAQNDFQENAPKLLPRQAKELLYLFYRLKYQRSPSWYYGLSEAEIKNWRNDTLPAGQLIILDTLRQIRRNPKMDLSNVYKSVGRTNEDLHFFCNNFLDSLELTGYNKKIKDLDKDYKKEVVDIK